jgi:NADH:ubiquinone oxidoreductase subunit 5 (subunit L)/multisubunit Na+/H+ antiporter MnhA subunit
MSGPAPVSALLHSATMVAAGVMLLVQLHPTLSTITWFGPVTVVIGLVTALAGALVAIASPHGKRLLAGSTSAHYGLMFVALGAGYPVIALFHFVAHALMKGPLFLIVGLAADKAGSYQLKALGETALPRPLEFATLGATLALAGLFPLGAGWTKEAVVTGAGHYAPWAAIAAAIAGGLSAIYAARFMCSLFPHFPRRPDRQPAAAQGEQRLQKGAIYSLVLATLAASVIWVPGISGSIASWLQSEVPAFKAWELILSMALVIAGVVLGASLAKRGRPAAGPNTTSRFISNWMGLTSLARFLVVVPVTRLAQVLAQADDRVVDAGIRSTARLALWTGDLGDRVGEWIFDEMPEGLARLSGNAGRQLRQVQSGMLHHYYFIITAGLIAIVLTFVAGTLMGEMP